MRLVFFYLLIHFFKYFHYSNLSSQSGIISLFRHKRKDTSIDKREEA